VSAREQVWWLASLRVPHPVTETNQNCDNRLNVEPEMQVAGICRRAFSFKPCMNGRTATPPPARIVLRMFEPAGVTHGLSACCSPTWTVSAMSMNPRQDSWASGPFLLSAEPETAASTSKLLCPLGKIAHPKICCGVVLIQPISAFSIPSRALEIVARVFNFLNRERTPRAPREGTALR
jgi:hypothetical protein